MKLSSVLFTCALIAGPTRLAAHQKRANALPLHFVQTSAIHSETPVIDQ